MMAAPLEHQRGAHPAVVAQEQVAAFEDRQMRQQRSAARDHPDNVYSL